MARSEQDLKPAPWPHPGWRWLLGGILAISAALRVGLVLRGGQMLWSDETRFDTAREAFGKMAEGDLAGATRLLLGGADHLLFKVIGLLPAAIERWSGATGHLVPGLFFAGFSVLNIYLVWRIARAAGAAVRESVLAAGLFALAATNFYYARHLFPYDLSLSFALLALWCGWGGPVQASAMRSLAGGVLAALGFLAYNGAWLFGAMVLIGHTLRVWPDWRAALRRAGWAALGLGAPIGLAIGLARLIGVDLITSFLYFSGTIAQGDFGHGARLVRDYFWAAEGINAVLGLAGVGVAVAGAMAARTWNRGLIWSAGAVFVFLGLWLPSDVWSKFVIYGRTARFMVPLVCLAGAFVLDRLWCTGGWPARLATVAAVLVIGQGLANLWPPVRQVFPTEFYRKASLLKDELRTQGEKRQLVIIYADMLVGHRSILATALPDHDVLLAERNPMQYRPYLFEGFDADNRNALIKHDVRMRLIAVNHARFDHPSDLVRPYPGVVRLTLRLPALRVPGTPEPLVVTGETGKGDFLYLVYHGENAIRLGFDHWGYHGQLSEPITVDPTKPVVITLSLGALHDPSVKPEGTDPRHWLFAEVNGQTVWSHRAAFHDAPPDSIAYLNNYIGGSTAGRKFSGSVLKIESLLIPPFAEQTEEIR